MTPTASIRAMTADDGPAVLRIYEEGIATGQATFELAAPSWEGWDAGHLSHSRFIAAIAGQVAGWAALCPVSKRACYAGVAEVSYYVGAAHRSRGVGKQLLNAAIASSEANGIWTLTAGIFPENAASIRLVEAAGFRLVGRRECIGQLRGVWRDTLLYERRSRIVDL